MAYTEPATLDMRLIQQEELIPKYIKPLNIDDRRPSFRVNDKIKDYRHVCLKDKKEATLVLRESGYLDFYFNCKRVASTDENEEDQVYEYTNIRMNFTSCLLTRRRRSDIN